MDAQLHIRYEGSQSGAELTEMTVTLGPLCGKARLESRQVDGWTFFMNDKSSWDRFDFNVGLRLQENESIENKVRLESISSFDSTDIEAGFDDVMKDKEGAVAKLVGDQGIAMILKKKSYHYNKFVAALKKVSVNVCEQLEGVTDAIKYVFIQFLDGEESIRPAPVASIDDDDMDSSIARLIHEHLWGNKKDPNNKSKDIDVIQPWLEKRLPPDDLARLNKMGFKHFTLSHEHCLRYIEPSGSQSAKVEAIRRKKMQRVT